MQHSQIKCMEEITSYKNQFNNNIESFIDQLGRVQVDNSTTRSLVKKQMDEFATLYSCIEINKAEIERVNRRIDNLPVIEDLAATDEYLNKYIPFKIQNQIGDTLFNVLSPVEMQKLLNYEQNIFERLKLNLRTIESKLFKQDHYVPSHDERERLLK